MKKRLLFLTTMFLICCLSSCADTNKNEEEVNQQTGEVESPSLSVDIYSEAEEKALEHFAVLLNAIDTDASGYYANVSSGTEAYKAIVEIENLYHANSDNEIITQLYNVAETVSALQTSVLISDPDYREQAAVYAASVDRNYSGPYSEEILAFAMKHSESVDTDKQDVYLSMTDEDKAIVIDFIEQRYRHYDEAAGTYTGDNNTDLIWVEAAELFNLTEAQLDTIWYDQDIWTLYRTGKYRFTPDAIPKKSLLDSVDLSTLDGVYDGAIARISYKYNDEEGDRKTLLQYDDEDHLVRRVFTFDNEITDTAYKYDDAGQILSEITYWYEMTGDGTLTQKVTTQNEYEYVVDDSGLLLSKRHIWTKGSVTTDELYEYTYQDELIQSYTHFNTNGDVEKTCEYVYDSTGKVASSLIVDNLWNSETVKAYSYDADGRLVKEVTTMTKPNAITERAVSYIYDSSGLISEMCETYTGWDYAVITRYEYDDAGRVTKEEIYHDEKYATSYTYKHYDLDGPSS